MKNVFIYIVTILFVFSPTIGEAAEKKIVSANSDAPYFFDGKSYTKGELLSYFSRAAFSDSLWSNFTASLENPIKGNSFGMTGQNAFFAEYFVRKSGFPKSGVVNKWPSNEVRVRLGSNPAISRSPTAYSEDTVQKFSKAIETTVSLINEKANFNLNFKASTQSSEEEAINVIPVNFLGDGQTKLIPFRYDFNETEFLSTIKAGVKFTANENSGVEGFFFPDSKNNIRFAGCYIDQDAEGPTLSSLVQECLIRSLGLPDVFTAKVQGTPPLLGKQSDKHFTDIDVKILSMLYCSDVKAGMDKYAALLALNASTCLK